MCCQLTSHGSSLPHLSPPHVRAQVAQCYPEDTAGFPAELMQLLDTHSEALDSALRQAAVKALILLRNRGQVSPMQVLPLFFRLFKCRDKALRQMLFSHIVAGETQDRAARLPISKDARTAALAFHARL